MTTMRDIHTGLEVLLRYGDGEFTAEHDQVWAMPTDAREKRLINYYDRLSLEAAGWFYEEEFECWSRFT